MAELLATKAKLVSSKTAVLTLSVTSRQTGPTLHKGLKNVNIWEFYIHYVESPWEIKYKISTNIPDIGSLVREIDVKKSEERKNNFDQ